MKLCKARVAGAVLAVLLVFSSVGPVAMAKSPAASLGPSTVTQVSSAQEEEISSDKLAMRELAAVAVDSLFMVTPEMKATNPAFPYMPLEAILGVVMPLMAPLFDIMPAVLIPTLTMLKPIEPALDYIIPLVDPAFEKIPPSFLDPILIPLPLIIVSLLQLVRGELECPELNEWVLPLLFGKMIESPYGLLGLLDMILNPFSLALLNPLTWSESIVCNALIVGFEPEYLVLCGIPFAPQLMANTIQIVSLWLTGLGVASGLETLLGIAAGAT